jgi:hypothetical protein
MSSDHQFLMGLDPSLRERAFADARDSAVAAQMDFAEAKEKYGPRVALAMFNARVDRWAREFTNPRISRVMYVATRSRSTAMCVTGRKATGTGW